MKIKKIKRLEEFQLLRHYRSVTMGSPSDDIDCFKLQSSKVVQPPVRRMKVLKTFGSLFFSYLSQSH